MNPPAFEHRSLQQHYTESQQSHIEKYGDSAVQAQYCFTIFTVSHMDIASLSLHIVTMSLVPLVINHTSLEHHYIKSVSHIEEFTYTHGRCTSSDIV